MVTQNLTGLRVAIYARYSSDNQREASIDDQVRRCRVHVEACGGTVTPELIFADHAVSGASLQRPAFEKMMALATAKQRGLDAIVTEDLSRITRDFADAAQVSLTWRNRDRDIASEDRRALRTVAALVLLARAA
jgi:DNA invertase Pin-like site-specific DNA recombinase